MKELKIEIPEGYIIDEEKSTFEKIIFKPKSKINNYYDLILEKKLLSGYIIDHSSDIIYISDVVALKQNRTLYMTKKEAVSTRAAAMISQLMPYYGGRINIEEWKDLSFKKYSIGFYNNEIVAIDTTTIYNYLSFRKKEYRDKFMKENIDLIKEYLMLD